MKAWLRHRCTMVHQLCHRAVVELGTIGTRSTTLTVMKDFIARVDTPTTRCALALSDGMQRRAYTVADNRR